MKNKNADVYIGKCLIKLSVISSEEQEAVTNTKNSALKIYHMFLKRGPLRNVGLF